MDNTFVQTTRSAGPTLQISLFGTTNVVTRRGVRATSFGGVKPRQILEILSMRPGEPVAKDHLAEIIWEGAPPRSHVATLESYVCLLRRSLEEARGQHSAIRTTTAGYLLDADRTTVDVAEARRLIGLAREATGAAVMALVSAAVDLARSELLASARYSTWATEQRVAFSAELAHACEEAAEVALAEGELADAVRLAREATSRDPLAERAWNAMIRSYAAQGRYAQGLNAYQELRGHLLEELGIEPGRANREAYQHLLAAMNNDGSPGNHAELSTLMVLLRQALEAVPGVSLPATDEALSGIAVRVLATAS